MCLLVCLFVPLVVVVVVVVVEISRGARRRWMEEGEGGKRETVASREGGTRGTLERAGRGSFLAFLLLLGPREQEPASKEKKRANESSSLQVQGRSGPRERRLGGSNLSGGWAGDNGVVCGLTGLSSNGQRKRRRRRRRALSSQRK
jgi:hypothetical protein